ncbi:MAG: hypothetical protein HC845_07830 [Akkermansiaceae bacterium]|nr:hypothetical protein [Akkermansiaceae bacterium]
MPSPDQSLPLTSMLPNLLLLIAVAAGIVVTEPSLSTDRVLRPETATRSENEKTGVRSSFWEDPLAISPGGQKASMPELSSAPLIPDERYLDERIKDKGRLDLANDRLLVLFVGLDGGGDPVAKERRIRTRVAVASALTGRASMLVNSAQEQLKPCFIPLVDSVQGAAMEIFEGLNFTDSRWFSVGRGKVNVVYLDENSIRPSPANMEQLVKASGQQGNPNCRFSYIGLCRSERLWSFLSSAIKKPPIAEQTLPSSIEVYSPYATAEDDMIWKHISPKTKTVASEKIRLPKGDTFVSNSYAFGNDSFRGALHRVGADDGDLARALIAELNVRGITSGSGGQEKQSGETTKDAVLILADMDRYHSRVLANSFSRAWQERYEVDRNADEKGKYILSEKLSQEVRVIHYTEALDGMLAAAKENPASKPENSVKQLINPGGKYAAEGTSQIDALRRFPARLHELEKANGVRYRAIGLLGSDVHDKLLLLKALKPSFPNSVFFTNDLDARLWQGEGRNASINLIVAGAFGLTLNSQLQGNVMPFRSSYQTATYLACLHAIDFKKRKDEPENPNRHYSDIQWPKAEVELHEVKRSGDHLLSYWGKSGNSPPGMLTKVSGRTSLADREATTAPFFRGIFQMLILIVLGILFFQIWWLMRADPDVKSPKRGLLISRIVVTLIVIICGAAALYMQTFADRDGAAGEIRELFSGVSAIPVASANCLIIAIGSVMVLRLFHARRPRPPYPFAQKEGGDFSGGESHI